MMDVCVKSISYKYKGQDQKVLNDVSFEAKSGQITGIIGANGVGKSTLLECILGRVNAKGEVIFGGKSDYVANELSAYVGYLTQDNVKIKSLSVFEMVLLGRINDLGLRVDEEHIEKVYKILCAFNIERFAKRNFCELSGGQQRLVSIAQILVKEPEVLILDEPTANLDMQNALEILELIKMYTEQKNVASLIVLHDLNLACRYCDKLVLLNHGKVFKQGTPFDVVTKESIKEAYGVSIHLHLDQKIPMIHPIYSTRNNKFNFSEM